MREIPASPSAVFRGVSYLLHPGHEYELGPSRSGFGARPISSMLAPWATVSCCSGSSHCSALCNYTVYNPPPLYSFSESVTPLPLPRSLVRFCSSAMLLVVQRASRRSWSRRGRRLRSNSRLRVPPSPSPSNPRPTHSIRPLLVRLDLLTRFSVTGCILNVRWQPDV